MYLTARGLTNETYYVAQKLVRFLGTNNVDNAARVCHAPSTGVLKAAVGAAATTCSYTDVIKSDLIVLFGANVANAQPVFMKYLFLARKHGAKVAVVNPLREPGLDRYWVPSNVESAMFGTRMTDEFFSVNTGGDIAFVNGILKVLLAEGGIDRDFVREHTVGFDDLLAELERESLAELERRSGATRADMERFARLYASARSAVLVWSMGITQHDHGSDAVAAIVNLGLARGNVGRPGAGLMPIRGHSGVQGGAEMGAYATAFPGGVPIDASSAAALTERYGFPVGQRPGLTAEEMLEAAAREELEVLYASGGNFLEVLPDPEGVRHALERVPLRVHQDIVVSSQMLVEPAETVVLLPAATRYEQRDGGTETTTERRIAFSPEIDGHQVGEARSEWEIFVDVARHVDPDRAHLVEFASGQAIRDEIADVVPAYDGIQWLRDTGDALQWGGTRLCDGWVFPTADGKAHFAAVAPPDRELPDGMYRLSTRRGKQFNTMVHHDRDPLTGARRDALFVSRADADAEGLQDGDLVLVRSEHGELRARTHISEVQPGNVQVFFPEGNVLIGGGIRDARSGVPDYNAVVTLERVGRASP
jgi:molybdopterin-dependent oxidoreductase alpha subunit